MKRLKKIIRLIGLVVLIFLASMGIGAPISFNSREKFMNNEVKIELAQTEEDEGENELDEQKG